MKVFGRRNSLNVQKVLWFVNELELQHEHIPLGGSFGGLETPEYRALNPHGKVPTIDDGGFAVWESHAILRYIAARYGGERFWPDDAARRSLADRWMDWSQSTFQPDFLSAVFWAYYRTPEAQRDWSVINRGIARSAEHVLLLDRILASRPFLGGDTLTLADVPAGSLLYRYYTLDIDRPNAPNVEAWYGRLQARPAYAEHVMVPYEDLRGRLAF